MIRLPLRSLTTRGLALVVLTGVVGVAHAAGLGGVSGGTLDAWTQPLPLTSTPVLAPPTIEIVGVTDGAIVSTLPLVTCVATDGLSSLLCHVEVTAIAPGLFTATATATDVAGNESTLTIQFTVTGVGS